MKYEGQKKKLFGHLMVQERNKLKNGRMTKMTNSP